MQVCQVIIINQVNGTRNLIKYLIKIIKKFQKEKKEKNKLSTLDKIKSLLKNERQEFNKKFIFKKNKKN